MTAWIFQANPKRFDLDSYLTRVDETLWMANQHRSDIAPGDPVFIWRTGDEAGIVAQAIVTEPAALRPDDVEARVFWGEPAEAGRSSYRVKLRIHRIAKEKEVVKRAWLLDDPVCADLPNLRFSQGTNYPLAPKHFERLSAMCARTGRPFDDNDLEVALLAYAETFGGPVSEKPDSPVAQAAVRIGRAVSSMYAKVMKFRALDPRHEGAGQPHGGEQDRVVWNRYWSGMEIDVERLRQAVDGATDRTGDVDAALADYQAIEGARRLVRHIRLERDRALVKRAKAVWLARDPQLRCEVCRLSFVEAYGDLGSGFIEAHHRSALAEVDGPVETTVDDLAPVCANCHRMLHRQEFMSIDDLRRSLRAR